jgi:hypothetical protein
MRWSGGRYFGSPAAEITHGRRYRAAASTGGVHDRAEIELRGARHKEARQVLLGGELGARPQAPSLAHSGGRGEILVPTATIGRA